MLSEFLTTNHDEIVAICRAKASARATPPVTSVELEIGIPLFLDQLTSTLQIQETTKTTPSDREIGLSAARHGSVLEDMGFTAAQVIHDYGNVCQSITELAVKMDAPITTDEFRTLNRCLDEAMAESVSEFGRQRETAIANDNTARQKGDQDLRSLIASAVLAYEALKSGSVGISGATGGLLGRHLLRMRDLMDRSRAAETETQRDQAVDESPAKDTAKR